MEKIRLRYTKTGKAAFISHLDLMTTLQRGLIRAGTALKYSDGFNPHPYISIALPMPVASESECELADVALRGGSIHDRVNEFMPEGLIIQKAYKGYRVFSEIKWIKAQCEMVFGTHSRTAEQTAIIELAEKLSDCFRSGSLIIPKKTKRGISEIDAALHIKNAGVDCGSDASGNACIFINAMISAQNPTIGCKDIKAVADKAISGSGANLPYPDYIKIKRIDIYDENMLLFK